MNSSLVVTDTEGNVTNLMDYMPYGSDRVNIQYGSYNPDNKFTDQKEDTESGLYYYGARYYNQSIGRFTQVDPRIMLAVAQIISDPQALNGYAYARNNPIRYIDPTGQTFGEFLVGIGKGAWEGVKSLATGVWEIIKDPTVIITGVTNFFSNAGESFVYLYSSYLEDPEGTLNQVHEALNYLVEGWENLSDEQKGEIVGYTLEKSLEAYIAVKGITKVMSGKNVMSDFGKNKLNDYYPTQDKVNPVIIEEYYNKIKIGDKLEPIDVATAEDGVTYILEGHHRYLASKKAGVDIEINKLEIGSPIGTTWDKVTYEKFIPEN